MKAQRSGFHLERRCSGMNETWRFAPGRGIWSLLKNKTKSKPSKAGLIWKRRCNGMNETWRFAPGRWIWSLLKNKTKSKPSKAGLIWKRRCNGMNETWRFAPGRGIWSLHRRCDEARLHFSSQEGRKIIVLPPSSRRQSTVHRTVETYFRVIVTA